MAELIAQVKIDGFECVADMAQAVLSWTYKGKTLKGWADSISEPKTNADRIRAMTDEELATFLYQFGDCPCFGVKFCELGTRCEDAVLMKLREEAER